MKYSSVALALLVLAWPASHAWAQYGLSGSPELLSLSPGVAGAQSANYPSTAAPSLVTADPAMRPISQPIPATVTTGYYGFATQAAPTPITPMTPPPSGPSVMPPALPPTAAPPLQPALPPTSPPTATFTPTLPPLSSAGPGAGLTGQMLTDPNSTSGNCWSGYGNGCATGPAPACPAPNCDLGACLYQPTWYASAAGLIMSRNNANRVWTSYINNHNPEQVLNTQDASSGWQGGFEVTLGRTFCCNNWAVEISYWWLGEMNGFAEVANRDYNYTADGFAYNTPLSFDNVVWADSTVGNTPYSIFGFARQHRIWRQDSFQNLELNLIRHQIRPDCGDGLSIDWSVGARYFRFDEQLKVGALRQNDPSTGEATHDWGDSGGIYEAYLDDTIHNSLVGCQVGLSAVYPVSPSLRFFLSPKFGIYDNHIQHRFSGYRGDGMPFAADPNSGVPGSFPVSGTTDALAFMTEINVGLDWNFARNWTAFMGYRVIWATGIGLAENQYIPYVVDIPGHQHIESNGELVLHGAFAGLTFCF